MLNLNYWYRSWEIHTLFNFPLSHWDLKLAKLTRSNVTGAAVRFTRGEALSRHHYLVIKADAELREPDGMRTVSLQINIKLHRHINVETGGVKLGFALHWKEREGPSHTPAHPGPNTRLSDPRSAERTHPHACSHRLLCGKCFDAHKGNSLFKNKRNLSKLQFQNQH